MVRVITSQSGAYRPVQARLNLLVRNPVDALNDNYRKIYFSLLFGFPQPSLSTESELESQIIYPQSELPNAWTKHLMVDR
jgi:hypothetical protein